jgi:hypothetical protein
MIIGCLTSFLIFGGLAYFITRMSLNLGYERDNRFLATLFYFLIPTIALSVITCLVIAAYSVMGFSVSLAVEAIASSLDFGSSGALVVIGSILTAIFGITAFAAGPATAFTAAQVSTVIAIVVMLAKNDREFSMTWLPRVALVTYGFCMWPFAAILTFGL